MTRQKEIEQAMKESVAETIYASGWGMTPQATDLLECAFTKGAEWADRTMFEKAIKWIEENIDLVAMDTVSAKSGYHQIVMMQDFKQKFREAMEE